MLNYHEMVISVTLRLIKVLFFFALEKNDVTMTYGEFSIFVHIEILCSFCVLFSFSFSFFFSNWWIKSYSSAGPKTKDKCTVFMSKSLQIA